MKMIQGLLVIDVQNDYFSGGAMELVGMSEAAQNCRQLLENFRQRQAPIFHVQHFSVREGSTFFIPDTFGCEIHESVSPLESETVIGKYFPSAFRETELNQKLHDGAVEEIIICGAMSHMCVDSTTRAGFDLGYSCQVIADACATRDLTYDGQLINAADVHASFMAALSAPFAQIRQTEQYIEGKSN